jgi:hypothetical protein
MSRASTAIRQRQGDNPLYASLLRDTQPQDLVHVLIKRLTRNRELYAAMNMPHRQELRVSDASVTEILVTIQQKLITPEPEAIEQGTLVGVNVSFVD